jgi:hypothetical protein
MRTLALFLLAAACTAPPPKRPPRDELVPVEEWRASALWLHATAGIPPEHAAECKGVAVVLERERKCEKQLCKYGAELASEWLDKCKKHAPDEVEKMSELAAQLSDEAERGKTECSTELAAMLEVCTSEDCRERARKWATSCGEGGPLAVAMLARAVERGAGERVELDARSCKTLRAEVREGSRCADEAACRAVWKTVGTHRAACREEGGAPDLAMAIWEATIVQHGAIETDPIRASEDADLSEVALAFADGGGAVIDVCRTQPADAAAYVAARRTCEGSMTIARRGDGGSLVLGRIALPSPHFAGLYPSLVVQDERAAEEAAAVTALKESLSELKAAGEADALRVLAGAIHRYARLLDGSETARAALRAEEAALTPLFVRIAKERAVAHAKIRDPILRLSFVDHSRSRPLAHVSLDGVVEPGARTNGMFFRAGDALPGAMAAYRKALAKLESQESQSTRPARPQLEAARKQAASAAKDCAAARARMTAIQAELYGCVLQGNCDSSALVAEWVDLHGKIDGARHVIEMATAFGGKAAATECPLP